MSVLSKSAKVASVESAMKAGSVHLRTCRSGRHIYVLKSSVFNGT